MMTRRKRWGWFLGSFAAGALSIVALDRLITYSVFTDMTILNHSGKPVYVETLEFAGSEIMEDEVLEGTRTFSGMEPDYRSQIDIRIRRTKYGDTEFHTFLLRQGDSLSCRFSMTITESTVEISECEFY